MAKIDVLLGKYNALARILLVAFVVLVVLAAVSIFSAERSGAPKQVCFKKENCVDLVGVMDTPQLRMKGLMGREPLAPREGMLFIFERPQQTDFWMKNVSFPIDIIWADGAGRILCIEKEAPPCDKEPCMTYPCLQKAKYVVELPAGFSDEYMIYVNDKINIKGMTE
ncbi:TPA: DUF192 domain-containing protein [Candidatus Woesearchaeota archaeon]|nr:DUF192 domain-containing protein [Candidatus Woesearchaeota archaeon]